MSDPQTPLDGLPDPLRRGGGGTDPPLSLDARTPGPRGFGRQMVWAALGLLILFAMFAAMWIASREGRKGQIERPPSRIELHP